MLNKIIELIDWVTLIRQKKLLKSIHSQLRELRILTWIWIDAKHWYQKDVPEIQHLIQKICESFSPSEDYLLDKAAKITQTASVQSSHYFKLYELISRARKTPNFDKNESDQKYWQELVPLAFDWLNNMFEKEKFEMNFENYKSHNSQD